METEAKYKSLIQPIKDLAQNWDIDIAEELGEYLEQLEHLTISVGSNQNLNFAEAALLIQGSTAVYSRKVEYLHQLVLQALELISSQKSDKAANNATVATRQKSNVSFLEDERLMFGSDPSYLLLDDILEEGVNITLDAQKEKQMIKEKRRSSAGRMSLSADTSRASMILMHSILQEDHGGSNLKLSTCRMDVSGALLMTGLFGANASTGAGGNTSVISNIGMGKDASFGDNGDGMNTSADIHQGAESSWQGGDCGDYGDDDNDHYAYESEPAEPNHPIGTVAVLTSTNTKLNAGSIDKPQTTLHKDKAAAAVPMGTHRNPLCLLDAHEASKDSKLARKGKTYRIPASLPPLGGRETSRKTSVPSSSGARANKNHVTPADVFTSILQGKIPMTGLSHMQFAAIAKEQRKSEFAQRRANRQINFNELLSAEDNSNGLKPEAAYYDDNDQDDDQPYYGHEDNAFHGNAEERLPIPEFQYGGYDDDEYVPESDAAPEPFADAAWPELDELDEEGLLARRVEQALSEELVLSQNVTYESLCRKHIENFMQGAERYARETQLSKRVADWTRRLEPILREQEESAPFDIREYSYLLMDKVDAAVHDPEHRRQSANDEAAETIEFIEVANGQNSTEICRMFLACLQLANTGNLLICPDSPSSVATENELSNFSVKILQSKILQEDDLETFRAPSLTGAESQDTENEALFNQKPKKRNASKRSQPLKQANSRNKSSTEEEDDAQSNDEITKPVKRTASQRASSRRAASQVF